MKIKKLPICERPYEKLINNGVSSLSNEELLAILIKSGTKEYSAKEVASILLEKFSNITDLKNEYKRIESFSEGLCRVSTLKLGSGSLAYHSDYEEDAGIWGYIDEKGNPVKGVKGTGQERVLTLILKTKINQEWKEIASKTSDANTTTHQNKAKIKETRLQQVRDSVVNTYVILPPTYLSYVLRHCQVYSSLTSTQRLT